jgi:hypothetical protein
VPLTLSDEGHKIEHKQTSDSVTKIELLWWNKMCDVQEDMGKHLVPLMSSDAGHKIEHKQISDSVIILHIASC